jgi:small subunit ribosomal protein S8
MAMTDPIADMLARLRNAHQALHAEVVMPKNKAKEAMAAILQEEGYIEGFESADRDLTVKLRYKSGQAIISGTKRISRPGRRVYVGVQDIPSVRNGLGICILSTSRGIMEGTKARSENVGGELLCEIW